MVGDPDRSLRGEKHRPERVNWKMRTTYPKKPQTGVEEDAHVGVLPSPAEPSNAMIFR